MVLSVMLERMQLVLLRPAVFQALEVTATNPHQ